MTIKASHRRPFPWALVTGMALLLVWGICGPRPTLAQNATDQPPGSPAPLRIVMVTHAGPGDPFWQAEFRGAADTAQALGVDLTILAPDSPNDFMSQLSLLTDAIETAPDGIATTISHPTAFGPLLQDARSRGIPVVAFNARPLHDDRKVNPYLAFIGMDDYRAGEVLATMILERGAVALPPSQHHSPPVTASMAPFVAAASSPADNPTTAPPSQGQPPSPSPGRVVVAMQQAGLTGLESRFLAIQTVLSNQGLTVDKLDVGSSPDTARQVFRAYMQSHGSVRAVIALGPAATHPLGRVIVQDSLPVYFAAFDLSPLTARLITDGILDFTIDQQPYMQGALAVHTLMMAARYAMVPPDIDTGIAVVDATSVGRIASIIKDGVR